MLRKSNCKMSLEASLCHTLFLSRHRHTEQATCESQSAEKSCLDHAERGLPAFGRFLAAESRILTQAIIDTCSRPIELKSVTIWRSSV